MNQRQANDFVTTIQFLEEQIHSSNFDMAYPFRGDPVQRSHNRLIESLDLMTPNRRISCSVLACLPLIFPRRLSFTVGFSQVHPNKVSVYRFKRGVTLSSGRCVSYLEACVDLYGITYYEHQALFKDRDARKRGLRAQIAFMWDFLDLKGWEVTTT